MSIHDDLERAAAYLSPEDSDSMDGAEADRIAAALRGLSLELAGLRRFAQRVLANWPEAAPDAFEIQDIAVDCGLLQLTDPAPTQPCGADCWCTSYFDAADFNDGSVRCYRRTQVLTGQPTTTELKP